MIDLLKLNDDCIIITSSNAKNILIKELNEKCPFKHVKFISKNELIESCYFTYSYNAVKYLKDKYNYILENSNEVLNNLWGIKPYNEKLDLLNSIYEELNTQGLLDFDPYFKELFRNKTVYIYGYLKEDKEITKVLDSINISYEYLSDEMNNKYHHEVMKFVSLEEEVIFTFNEICKLVDSGVSLNNIYFFEYPREYDLIIDKYALYHNLKLEKKNENKLNDSPIFKKFISLLDAYELEEAFNLLKDEVLIDNFDVIDEIIKIVTDLDDLKLSKDELILFIKYLAKNKSLKTLHYDNSIKVIDDKTILSENDHVFMLGFSLGIYPKVYQDTSFLSDEELEYLGKNTSKIKNEMAEKSLILFIEKTPNLTITFKEKNDKTKYYPSLLIDKLEMKLVVKELNNIRYSEELAHLEVARYYDLKRSYGLENKYLATYSKDVLRYCAYNNQFTGLLNYYNDQNLVLSSTQINEYNKCPFSYFVKRVLKADIFEETFSLKLGNLFHLILQDSVSKVIDLKDYEEEINKNFKTERERFLFSLVLPQINDIINKNNEFLKISDYNKVLAEQEIQYSFDDKSHIVGKIDKTLIDEIGKNYIVVDYKTGDFKFDKVKVKYGLDMQLPMYSFLINKEHKNYTNVGIYIQNICLNKKELASKNAYSLKGLTLNDETRIKRLDKELGTLFDENDKLINKSNYIYNLQLNNKKLLKKEEFKILEDLVEEQIKLAFENIRKGNFMVSPVAYRKEELPCVYCSCKDICYKKPSDKRIIIPKEGEDDDEIHD